MDNIVGFIDELSQQVKCEMKTDVTSNSLLLTDVYTTDLKMAVNLKPPDRVTTNMCAKADKQIDERNFCLLVKLAHYTEMP